MLLSWAAASFSPSHADSLNDLSLIPPVSVTTQALNFGVAEAVTEVEATLTVNVPRIKVPVPSMVARRRILPMKISPYSFVNPAQGLSSVLMSSDVASSHLWMFVTRDTSPEWLIECERNERGATFNSLEIVKLWFRRATGETGHREGQCEGQQGDHGRDQECPLVALRERGVTTQVVQ